CGHETLTCVQVIQALSSIKPSLVQSQSQDATDDEESEEESDEESTFQFNPFASELTALSARLDGVIAANQALQQTQSNLVTETDRLRSELLSLSAANQELSRVQSLLKQDNENLLVQLSASNSRLDSANSDITALRKSTEALSLAVSTPPQPTPAAPSTPLTYAAATRPALTPEQLALVASMKPAPKPYRARRPTPSGPPTPSATSRLYFGNVLSCRLSVFKQRLRSLRIRTSAIHNIAFVGRAICELLVETSYKDSLIARLTEFSFKYLPTYDPAVPQDPNISEETRARLRAAFATRMQNSASGATRPAVRQVFIQMMTDASIEIPQDLRDTTTPPDSTELAITAASSLAINAPQGMSSTSSEEVDVLNAMEEMTRRVLSQIAEAAIDKSVDDSLRSRPFCGEESEEESEEKEGEEETTVADADIIPLEETKAVLDAKVLAHIREALRDSLFSDPYITDTAEYLGIAEDEVMKVMNVGKTRNKDLLVFFLKRCYFADWKARHQITIGSEFNPRDDPYTYTSDRPRGVAAAMGRRAGYICTRFDCHCKGEPRKVKGRQPGGKTGKIRRRDKSIACKCESYFNAVLQPGTVLPDGRFEDVYRIEYQFKHNHMLGGDNSVGSLQKSRAVRDRIKAMLLRGMTISTIMKQLTMDHAKFTRLLVDGKNSRFSRDDFISYDDVYNVFYDIMARRMRKDEDARISARLWMESLQEEGFFTYYDEEHGFGIPVAFFLTTTPIWQVLEGWLRALKDKMDQQWDKEFLPTAVITDQGATEINAIQAVWPLGLRIFYCAWHVLQAWERKLTIQNLGSSNLSSLEKDARKRRVRSELRSILYAGTENEAEALIVAFRTAWQELAPNLVQYMDKNYFDNLADRRRWMYCHRADVSYARINTNNYIESWHNSLKKHFFKDKQQRRIDHVIYTLVHSAIPHYQQMCIRHSMQVGRMTPGAKEILVANLTASNYVERRRAEDPGFAFLTPTTDPAVFKVASFQGSPTTYAVSVDWTLGIAGHVNSCSCPMFVKSSQCCKHIALAIMELPYTEYRHTDHWRHRDSFADDPLDQDQDTPVMAAALEPASMMLYRSYVKRISDSLDIMDPERAITNQEEVFS
ncbi:hypothetical protein BGZ75_010444, partial [Mortierella antarctica]